AQAGAKGQIGRAFGALGSDGVAPSARWLGRGRAFGALARTRSRLRRVGVGRGRAFGALARTRSRLRRVRFRCRAALSGPPDPEIAMRMMLPMLFLLLPIVAFAQVKRVNPPTLTKP